MAQQPRQVQYERELVAFRVDRLIVHELLVHVTTGIAVPDGRDYEDLGNNFREIASTILNRFIAPHREDLARTFEQLKHNARVIIERELLKAFDTPNMPVQVSQPGFSRWLFAFGKRPRRTAHGQDCCLHLHAMPPSTRTNEPVVKLDLLEAR